MLNSRMVNIYVRLVWNSTAFHINLLISLIEVSFQDFNCLFWPKKKAQLKHVQVKCFKKCVRNCAESKHQNYIHLQNVKMPEIKQCTFASESRWGKRFPLILAFCTCTTNMNANIKR